MKIVIDGRMFNQSGIGRYIRNLIGNLQIIDRENEYFILHLKEDFTKLNYSNNFHKILADFNWYGITEQVKLLKVLQSIKPDVVHFPHFNVPIFYQGKFVVTIHDLIHQHFSMQRSSTHGSLVYKLKQLGYKKIFQNAVSKSCKILVPSKYVQNLLVTQWKVDLDKIIVTPEAVDEEIVNKCQMLFRDFNIKEPYIFYVGNAHPHKNVEGLIRAFRAFRGLKLVLAGNDHYFWQKIRKEFQDKDIIYAGGISEEELVSYYKNAEVFVMPSFEEGFGIPLLEAMSLGCPVVSSNAGSLPEVGGDAAIYFDPAKPDDMVEKIKMVLESEKIRKELIEKGLKRYKEFSWKKLAKETLEVYLQCV